MHIYMHRAHCAHAGEGGIHAVDGTDECMPLAVYVQIEFWICLLLCFFGYLPGVIYAVWVIIRKEDD